MEVFAILASTATALAVAVINNRSKSVSRKVDGWERAYRDCERRLRNLEGKMGVSSPPT